MSCLRLYLLCSPHIEIDDVAVEADTRKAIALLAYLVIMGERQRRDALANLLWPELDRSHGRTALRRTLYALRKALDGDWLEVDRETIGLDPGADTWLDVDRFHRHLAACLTHGHPAREVCAACVAPLSAAAELYSGDFMAGFSLRDSLNFDDWQFFQAEALREEFAGVLEKLVRCHSAQGAFDSALGYARRWLTLDPLNEAAHCQLMCLYAWSGQRTAAMRQYQACVQVLEDELGTQPQARTTVLYEAIAQGRPPQPPEALIGPERPVTVGTTELTQIGAMLENRYRLDAELGRGNLGVVYRARDTLLERDVANKVVLAQALGPEGRARLAQEARAAAKLNHPNIVAVHDVGGLDDAASVAYIVMELVNGPALSEWRPPTLEETLRIGRELCAALEHAHATALFIAMSNQRTCY
jgi:DNA-binding SARP family transcriptional activator